MKKPIVDQTKCIGCGTCAALCPKTFEIEEDGKAYVKEQPGDSEEDIKTAIDSCPVQAIS